MGNSLVNMRDQKFALYEQHGLEALFASERYKEFSRSRCEGFSSKQSRQYNSL